METSKCLTRFLFLQVLISVISVLALRSPDAGWVPWYRIISILVTVIAGIPVVRISYKERKTAPGARWVYPCVVIAVVLLIIANGMMLYHGR